MTAAVAEALSLEQLLKAQACGLGFDLVGITSLGPMETAREFDEWVAKGYAGEMGYLNAAVVLGNIGDKGDTLALARAAEDPEPLVRQHAAWALDQIAARSR